MPPNDERRPLAEAGSAAAAEGHASTPTADGATFHPRLSAYIDRAIAQLEACPDDACRRAWRAVLDGLEEMLPPGVGEPVR